jgi:hypothetical protein
MIYKQLSPFIHVFANPSARKKFEIEITYSSGGSWFEKNLDRGKKHLLESRAKRRQQTSKYLFTNLE